MGQLFSLERLVIKFIMNLLDTMQFVPYMYRTVCDRFKRKLFSFKVNKHVVLLALNKKRFGEKNPNLVISHYFLFFVRSFDRKN